MALTKHYRGIARRGEHHKTTRSGSFSGSVMVKVQYPSAEYVTPLPSEHHRKLESVVFQRSSMPCGEEYSIARHLKIDG